jgi:hypothetical protein
LIQVGDKVKIFLDNEIEKAKKKHYANSSVVDFWKAINGRIGVVCEINGDNIWVKGPQGIARRFREDVLIK